MVGTRRNKSTGGNDPDPESNKPKKLTKAQLKQMDDVCVCFFNEILSINLIFIVFYSDSAFGSICDSER